MLGGALSGTHLALVPEQQLLTVAGRGDRREQAATCAACTCCPHSLDTPRQHVWLAGGCQACFCSPDRSRASLLLLAGSCKLATVYLLCEQQAISCADWYRDASAPPLTIVGGCLQERKVAADSLRKLASFMTQAAPALMEFLSGCTDIPDQQRPEVFFQTVKAATDVRCSIRMCRFSITKVQ